MHYNKIRKMDISNGPGVRVSIFMQGCTFKCPDCFNKETWDFDEGKEFNDEVINTVIDLCKQSHIKGLSILGGEPLHPKNIEGTTMLAKKFKEKLPEKNIWLWTGFKFENIKNNDIINYIDVLVDGPFISDLKDPRLKYMGSSNQRPIDIKKTLEKDNIIIYEGD